MRHIRKIASLLLGAAMMFGTVSLPVYAEEIAAPETTLQTEATEPENTVSVTTESTHPEEMTEATAVEEIPEPTVTETVEAIPEEEDSGTVQEEASVKFSQSSSMDFDASGYGASLQSVPLYLQTDYPDTPYSGGSVATSGCSVTAIAMVATYLTGEEYLPDELAARFGTYDASNIQRMEAAATVLDLTYTKTTQWDQVTDALAEGQVAIALLEKSSPLTDGQHMVVLTGINEDGSILVNDPYGPNYKKSELADGFAHGFQPQVLRTGFGEAWIFEDYRPPVSGPSRYPAMELTDAEKYLLASIIWLEARGESFEGQQAIAEIVFNRMASDGFSETVTGTIMAEGQFRTVPFLDEAKPGELQYKAIEKALSGPNVLPMDVYFFGRKPANSHVWGTIGGHTFCYGN